MRQKKFALYIRPVARNTTPMGHRRGPNFANMLAIAEKSKILEKLRFLSALLLWGFSTKCPVLKYRDNTYI